MVRSSLCVYCKHLRPGLPKTCAAFPDGVPREFLSGEKLHVAPVEGDHGIQFELADDLPESCQRLALRMVEATQASVHGQQQSES